MELIKIPQVSLVDASGKSIGVYTDDPDWWQQLKMKQQIHAQTIKNTLNEENALNDAVAAAALAATSIGPINNQNNNVMENFMGLKEYIGRTKADESVPLPLKSIHKLTDEIMGTIAQTSHEDPNDLQCNVIGETPLHIAIIYNDLSTIKFLIEKRGYQVNQRSVIGRFQSGFTSKDAVKAINSSQYEGLAYFGEYPLAFSACFANKDVYDYLLSKGADPNLQDSYGNTVLHILVINNRLDMFKYAIKHPTRKADLTIRNNQSLTPLNLAAKLGRENLFSEMLELRNVEFWRFHNITCSAFPLDGLDTIGEGGKIEWNAALSFIINGSTDDHLEMIQSGVVRRLLDDKWSTYAQRRFFQRLAIAVIHLIFLSIAVYLRKEDIDNLTVWPPKTASTVIRYISEVGVLIGCIWTIGLQIQEIYAQGFLYFIKNLASEPAKVFFQLSCILILIAVPFRFVTFSSEEYKLLTPRSVEDSLIILALPCGWLFLLFFFRVASITGPFVVMIYKMIAGDILTFSYIYGIGLFGFSLSFYYLYKSVAVGVTTFDNFEDAVIMAFQMTMGEFNDRINEMNKVQYPEFTKCIFVIFMVLVHILLLNMLIAMMGNTYQQIIQKSEREWRRQWAHIVILLERTFTAKELEKFQQSYSLNLPNPKSSEGVKDTLALMVIKTTHKTKAFQRKNALKNWKKCGHHIMDLLKQKKCSPTDLFPRSESPIYFSPRRQSKLEDAKWTKLFNIDSNTAIDMKQLEDIKEHEHETSTSVTTATTTKSNVTPQSTIVVTSPQMKTSQQHLKKMMFGPSQANKIYPMISTSLSNIDNLIADVLDVDESNPNGNVDGKMKLSNALKDSIAYIKNEELPKFKKITKFQRKSSANSSATELLREQNNSPEKN